MKENIFSTKMATKTTSELETILNNKSNYQADAVLAAAWELEKRGSDDYQGVEQEILAQQTQREEKKKKESNYTDDPSAPQLYPPKFILIYGALFSVFFGGILLAMNLSTLKKTKLAWAAFVCSLVYTIAQITILNFLNTDSLTLFVSLLGVYLIERLFWRTRVDSELKFRKRSIWPPLIIAILIYAPLVYFIIAFGV